ncbi:MAG: hypothetical protein PF542_00865 [Nanoarchaeota archaeon]|jgi:hypothetical protein|nr:hypothetical protein [Nanoarchaeota archaeon]
MTSEKQKIAAKKNIKKAQAKWKSMTKSEHAAAQPEGRARKRPGEVGEGDFYRIEVRPKELFVMYRNQDVGDKGHLERVAGQRKNGHWATQCWLVEKKDAKVVGDKIVGKTKEIKEFLSKLGSEPVLVKGDIFKAKE